MADFVAALKNLAEHCGYNDTLETMRKDFRITPYIYYACTMINCVCALLLLKTIETPEGIEYIH